MFNSQPNIFDILDLENRHIFNEVKIIINSFNNILNIQTDFKNNILFPNLIDKY